MRAFLAIVMAALLIPSLGFAMPVSAVAPAIQEFSISGSPFAPNLAPLPTSVEARLVLERDARVAVRVLNKNGHLVRLLQAKTPLASGAHSWTWDGRNDSGAIVRDGRYQVRVRVEAGATTSISRWIRKGLPQIYPANPDAVVVVVDPGHGGRFPGAVRDGFMEKDFNLDIGLRLQALLEHSGVEVVMTRTTDVAVNEPKSDVNGDGVLDRYDDDLERNDIANLARADIAVHVHNNASTNPNGHGTKAFVPADRSWTPDAKPLGELVVDEVAAALQPYRSPAFMPQNKGLHTGWYYYMGPYDPPFLIRPALMTSVLSESLYVSNPAELEALKRTDVRTSIAAGIYIGIARWLNTRDLGIGYELVSGPPAAVDAGSAVSYRIRVTNRGNEASNGWSLQLRSVPAVPMYDGSEQPGTFVGATAVPDGLQPGASVELTVNGTAPSAAGDWLIKSDAQVAGGSFASEAGVVPLQLPLTTSASGAP